MGETPCEFDHDLAIVRYVDGSIGDDDLAVLNAMLRDDAVLRAEFVARCRVIAELHERHAAANRTRPTLAQSQPVDAEQPSRFRISGAFAYGVAAAILVACGLAVYLLVMSPPRSAPDAPVRLVATLIDSTGTVIVNDDVANPGHDYAAGIYSIDSGRAHFMLTNSVAVNLRGRSRLTMSDAMHATLSEGAATFRCPPEATGYTVRVPGGARIIDLGTAFDVAIGPNEQTRLHVTEGAVKVIAEGTAEPLHLSVGQTAIIDHGGGGALLLPAFAGSIPLGNLFDDPALTTLADAVASDTFSAVAEAGDLGVERVVRGGDVSGTVQAIAPDITIDLDALGWSDASTPRPPANAAWDGANGGGLRVTGKRMAARSARLDDGVGMHANTLLTIDLFALRAAGGLSPESPMRFVADRAGVNDEAVGLGSVRMAAIVSDDIEPVAISGPGGGLSIEAGDDAGRPLRIVRGKATTDARDIKLEIPAGARWLTLICAAADRKINSDHGAFIGARIEIGPKETTLPETTRWNGSTESDGPAQR